MLFSTTDILWMAGNPTIQQFKLSYLYEPI